MSRASSFQDVDAHPEVFGQDLVGPAVLLHRPPQYGRGHWAQVHGRGVPSVSADNSRQACHDSPSISRLLDTLCTSAPTRAPRFWEATAAGLDPDVLRHHAHLISLQVLDRS